jgi:sugar lactone lactonase YvrE
MKYFIAFLLLFSPTVPLFAQSQDNWSLSPKKLLLPDISTGRKCLLINENGFYVGKMGPKTSSMGDDTTKTIAIEQYLPDATFKKTWSASFVNLGGLCSDASGNVYVFDIGDAKVKKFDSEGSLITSWGSSGTGPGQFSKLGWMGNGIACDLENNIYVVDSDTYRIQKFDSSGTFLLSFGSSGLIPGQFPNKPSAVSALPDGMVLVSAPATSYYLSVNLSDTQTFLWSGQPINRTSVRGFYDARAFQCVSPDGLIASADGSSFFYEWDPNLGYLPDISRDDWPRSISIFDPRENRVNQLSVGVGRIHGGAFDRDGNLWVCRGASVVCYERRYRFDSHAPRKILPLPQITNVSQPPNVPVVDIDYRVMDRDSPTVSTGLVAFIGGTRSWQNLVVPKTFTTGTLGLLGAGVPTGTGTLRVTWNAAADMPGKTTENLAIEALAKDDRPELGVRFVTVPADASNSQPLKVSSRAVQENDL